MQLKGSVVVACGIFRDQGLNLPHVLSIGRWILNC